MSGGVKNLKNDQGKSDILFASAVKLRADGLLDQAADTLRLALDADPDHIPALVELGNTLYSKALMNDAADCYLRVLRMKPDLAVVHSNLGIVLQEQGKTVEAIEAYRKALELDPGYASARSNLLRCLNFHPSLTNEQLFEAHKSFDALYGLPHCDGFRQFTFVPDVEKRLRIGYVSPDFGVHSIAYFVTSVFPKHNRENFMIFCYSDRMREDATSERINIGADVWRRTSGMNDETLSSLIRDDKIDILVDLAGHTGVNRLPVFASRPAPVQVAWLGYPNTTGLSAMDYRIVDDVTDPQGEADLYHTETLVRMADGFLCFDPPGKSPEVAPPPLLRNGFVTFGSFNALAKINDEVIKLWSRILASVPGSRFLLKNKCLFDEKTRNELKSSFASHGIDPGRILMTPFNNSAEEHLAQYMHMDISIDTFPYNGTTTTCESLWMGVPVIGVLGNRHASRVTASIITRLGLDALVARTSDECTEIAAFLARNVGLLKMIRYGLRERMLTSRLCDAVGFTAELEEAYRNMWRRWVYSMGKNN